MLLGLVMASILAADLPRDLPPDGLPRGQVIATVQCKEDSGQSYALYLPSTYTPDHEWPVIFGFDPGGRGLNPVERYRAAAEKYGYIVAGSNNSRNGPWAVSVAAVTAMTRDVTTRFAVLQNREYVAGMSGGSRVALGVALSSPNIAGVFASSAGYPDSKPRTELPFPVFESAGTEDFNLFEMRGIDRDLKSPHRLAIFEGGHMWLPPEVATEAVEWMELQAMKSGRKTRDQAEIDAIFTARVAGVTDASASALMEDFAGLEDVSRFAAAAKRFKADKHARDEAKKEQDMERREMELNQLIHGEEALLSDASRREDALKQLRQRWKTLSETAKAPDDTPERRMARRVLGGLSASGLPQDADYQAIVREYRIPRGGR